MKDASRRKRLSRTFLPHEENDHTPHALKHKALFVYSLLLVSLKVFVLIVSVMLPAAFVFSSAITATNIINLTNATRSAQGLEPLKGHQALMNAAQAKANDMLQSEYFAHTSPSGATPWTWINQSGYDYTLAGENLAIHFTTAEGVFEGWLASPAHRDNIVNDRFSDIGVGITRGEFDGFESTIVVQMFGEPTESEQPVDTDAVEEPTVENAPPEEDITPEEPEETDPQPTEPVADSEESTDDSAFVAIDDTEAGAALGVENQAPKIDTTSLHVNPSDNGYDISIAVENADTVQARSGTKTQSLEPSLEEEGVWSGAVPFEQESAKIDGQPVFVDAQNANSAQVSEPVGWVAPNGDTPNLYAFSTTPTPDVRLFGIFDVRNLDDMAGRIYFSTIALLGALLIMNVLFKFEVQKHSTTAHVMVVMILAAVLALI